MKIKLTQPASVNGGAYRYKAGQVVTETDAPAWVLEILLGGGYAVEVKERKPKPAETQEA